MYNTTSCKSYEDILKEYISKKREYTAYYADCDFFTGGFTPTPHTSFTLSAKKDLEEDFLEIERFFTKMEEHCKKEGFSGIRDYINLAEVVSFSEQDLMKVIASSTSEDSLEIIRLKEEELNYAREILKNLLEDA